MKKTSNKKLTLQPQTLRILQILALKGAVAGLAGTSDTVKGQSCTCNT